MTNANEVPVVYVIRDRTDSNFNKPFVAIHHDAKKAYEDCDARRLKVSEPARKFIEVHMVYCDS